MNIINFFCFRPISVMRYCLMFISLLWFGALALRAADRYVVAPGTIADGGGGIYTDWTIAATQIQWAVDTAVNAGDTVWVSNGVYVLTNQIEVTNTIILRSANGPNVTVINGNFVAGALVTNRCLLMSNAAAFVHGFTISNGACIGMVNYYGGAGVRMYSGILSNCVVCNNTVFSPAGVFLMGGGIYGSGGTVTACRVTGNLMTNSPGAVPGAVGGYGGGIYATSAGYLISDSIISNNLVAVVGPECNGGGIYASDGVRIRSSLICNNRAANGYAGGVYILYSSVMEGCTVTVNRAATMGGCRLNQGGTVSNCVISYNMSEHYASAGGIHMTPVYAGYACRVYNTSIIGNINDGVRMDSQEGKNQLLNCVIRDNSVYGVVMYGTNDCVSNSVVSGNGTGVYSAPYLRNAGVYMWNGCIRNCLITGNTNGGGLLIGDFLPWGAGFSCQTALVSCCTITSNRSTSAGSGIRIEATAPNILSISSCIIYSNGVSGADDVYDACAPTNISALQYSCIGTNPGGYFTGAGIKVADPRFAGFAGGNYRLAADSPCINAGSNETWMTTGVDLDGRARIRYGTVDMGAYERINEGTVYGVR